MILLDEVCTVVKFTETESKVVATRGTRKGRMDEGTENFSQDDETFHTQAVVMVVRLCKYNQQNSALHLKTVEMVHFLSCVFVIAV